MRITEDIEMLSQSSEYALRAAIYLAQRPEASPIPADAIAQAIGAPKNYLAKVLNALSRQGLLGSTRGRTGGFWLATPPEKISLAEVIEPFQEPACNPICLMGGRRCSNRDPCDLHTRWSSVKQGVWLPLQQTTLAALLGQTETQAAAAGWEAGSSTSSALPGDHLYRNGPL